VLEKVSVLIGSMNKRGYKDVQLAKLFGISNNYFSLLKNDKRHSPSLKVYQKILDIQEHSDNELAKLLYAL